MTQSERREYLIKYLLNEDIKNKNLNIPIEKKEQENLLRSLMNMRLPKPIDEKFLKIQDEYLKERIIERGIVNFEDLKSVNTDDRIYIFKGDITKLKCDAIVNACNSKMLGCFIPLHDCIDNFIHTYAGIELRLKMYEIMKSQGSDEETGKAKITLAYNLPAKYIIHTVGPVVNKKLEKKHEELLSFCYKSCMEKADEYKLKSIAFCCLSTGVFMFPNKRACEIAIDTVKKYLNDTKSNIKVIFNIFKDIDFEIYNKLLS